MNELLFMLPYFLIIGVLVGTLSMLFGIGGGLIIVPSTLIFAERSGIAPALAMKVAVATSLITIMTSTLYVLYKQNKSRNVLWGLVSKFIPFVVAGALCGNIISHFTSGTILTYLFIIFLGIIIIHSLTKKDFKTPYHLSDFKAPSIHSRGLMAFFVGNLSILIGVGGNIVLVPYLRHYKMPMKNATAFTVAIMPVLALIGSIGYIISGLHLKSTLPDYYLGFINTPAFVLIQMGSFAGASLGQRLLKHMNDKIQAKAYLWFLIFVFTLMIITTFF